MRNHFKRLERFRFSLRELLYACALLAISFTWPILLVFVVPILLAAVLSRLGFGSAAPVVVAAGLSIAAGGAVSFGLWGYPFNPPNLLPELRNVETVRQLSWFTGLNEERGSAPKISAVVAIPPASALQWNTSTELLPTQRILDEFGRRKLAIQSAKPVNAEVLGSLWRTVNDAGMLLDGNPDRKNTKTLLDGYFGIAKLDDGGEVLFATARGDEYSNDHYPYYEWIFRHEPQGVVLVNSQSFFFDVSGIEGFTWKPAAVFAFFVLCPSLCLVWWKIAGRRSFVD